jgi:hypothetical protein
MNSNTTKWLVGAALALFAYIFLIEQRSEDSAQRSAQSAKIFPNFDAAKVTSFEIARTNQVTRTNQLLRVEQANDRWRLLTPFYPAQKTGIESFLQAVSQLERRAYIAAKDLPSQPGWQSSFGLAPARASIQIQEGTNRIRFNIGSKTLMGNQLYLQILPDAGVYVTDASFLDTLPESGTEWRHPMLVHLDRLSFDRVAITNGARFLEIHRDSTNQTWRLLKPPPSARADFNMVDLLIKQLWSAPIGQFVTDDPKADLEIYGLQSPDVELTLGAGTNPVFQVQFGKSPTNDPTQVYARRLSHTNIVLVPLALVEFLRKPHTDFRDRTLLSFDPSVVDRIEVQAKERFALQRQTNGWAIVEPFQAGADPLLVREFFDTLGKLEIEKFENDAVTDFSLFGLAPPARQYILRSAITNAAGITNQIIAQVDFSTNRADHTVFARRSGETEKSVYVVSYGDSLRLNQAAYELRDRRIWNFASSNVVRVTITQHGQTQTVARSASRLWSTNFVENAAFEETVLLLGQLQAIGWTGRGEANLSSLGFKPDPHRIALEVAAGGKAQTYTVEFGKEGPQRRRYAAVRLEAGEPIIFEFSGALYSEYVGRYLSLPPAASGP